MSWRTMPRSDDAGAADPLNKLLLPCSGRNVVAPNIPTFCMGLAAKKIAQRNPAPGEHFARTIKTGTRCICAPDPRLPIEWMF